MRLVRLEKGSTEWPAIVAGVLRCGVFTMRDREMEERIEALEQQVISLSSALAVIEGDLCYKIALLETAMDDKAAQQDEAA